MCVYIKRDKNHFYRKCEKDENFGGVSEVEYFELKEMS